MRRNMVTINWKNSEAEAVCKLAAKTGMCRAYFRRWYFDYTSGVCKQFIFGGCSPNRNNFISESECTDFCAQVPTPKSFGPSSEAIAVFGSGLATSPNSGQEASHSSTTAVKDNYEEIVWLYKEASPSLVNNTDGN